jgi:hypothetical protein
VFALVIAGRIRRENFGDPVGSTPHTARIDLLQVANNENVRLHNGVYLTTEPDDNPLVV